MIDILYSIIIYPIVLIIEFVFVFANEILKHPGFAITCVSLVISVCCLPLYMVAEKWQEIERNIQRTFSPRIAKIKSSFKGDEQYMILSAFYRQNHYHPLFALRSSFGLLFQIPFFIAGYTYLSHLELLNGVSFLFINDLGKPDTLIPIGNGINLLPILMTLINCTSGVIYTKDLLVKDKLQVYGLALLFLILLYNSPSALVIYWTLNNIFSLLKNLYFKLDFKYKRFILFSLITIIAFSLSFYSLFILINNFKVRLLISIISLLIGLSPWFLPSLSKLFSKVDFSLWLKKETFILFLVSILLIWSSIGIFTPSMLIHSSTQEFSYIDKVSSPLIFIFTVIFQALGLFVFWPLIIYFLLTEKAKKIFSLLTSILSIIVLFNIFLFPGNYGPISNSLVFSTNVNHYFKESLFNLSILFIVFLAVLFIYFFKFKKLLSVLSILLLTAILFYSLFNIININNEYKKLSEYYKPEVKFAGTVTPIFNLSKNSNNVIIIMLDMASSVFIPYIFEENPELKNTFEGFTYYPNTVTYNGWTIGGAPPIFGGYEYTPKYIYEQSEHTFLDKYNESLLLLPQMFSGSGYNVVITDPPYANNNWIPDLRIFENNNSVKSYITDGVYTDTWLKQNNINLPAQSAVLKRNILWYSILRSSPLIFRQGIYYKGSWCAPFSENWMRTFLNGYAVLDFLPKLTEIDNSEKGTAVIMTNNTTHESLFLQAPEYKPQIVVTDFGTGRFNKEIWYHVNAAAIKRLSDYFIFLKENNVYDNTRIILVSDHGRLETTYLTKTSLPFHVDQFNPILFFKDFNSGGSLNTDMTFMTTADVPFLAINNIIDNLNNPFTGNLITENSKIEPQLIMIKRLPRSNNYEVELNDHNHYYVTDNIFDENNWRKP